MKKIFTLFTAIVCGLALNAKTIYLNTGGSELWNQADAVFFAHSWASESDNADVKMALVAGDIYSAEINDAHGNILFVRMPSGSEAINWETKWNKTSDLQIPADKDQYTITGWGESDGNWSVYDPNANPGGDNPGENPGGTTSGAKDYFLKGYCNGADITTPTAEEQFEGGMLEYTFTGDDTNHMGYFFILVCEVGQVVGDCYMTGEFTTESHCTLVKEDATHVQKLGVPEGTVTFYLYDNGDGSLELSTEPLPGKTLVGGGNEEQQGIENTQVSTKAHKRIIDGRLVIIRGEKMFDATGRQL